MGSRAAVQVVRARRKRQRRREWVRAFYLKRSLRYWELLRELGRGTAEALNEAVLHVKERNALR